MDVALDCSHGGDRQPMLDVTNSARASSRKRSANKLFQDFVEPVGGRGPSKGKGGRPKGSKDSAPRVRKPIYKPYYNLKEHISPEVAAKYADRKAKLAEWEEKQREMNLQHPAFLADGASGSRELQDVEAVAIEALASLAQANATNSS